jgi:phage terminase small subunit
MSKWYEQLDEAIREMVDEVVEEKLEDYNKTDIDDIRGFEEAVRDIVENEKPDLNTDDIENFEDAVRDECMSALDDNFQRLAHKVFKEDEDVRKLLKDIVRETIVEVVSEVVKGLVLKGQS